MVLRLFFNGICCSLFCNTAAFSSLVLSSLGKLLDSLWPEPIAEFTLYPCSCRNKSEIWKGGSVWTTRTEQYNLWFGDTWSQWWKQQWQFYATGHKIMGSKSNSCLTKKVRKNSDFVHRDMRSYDWLIWLPFWKSEEVQAVFFQPTLDSPSCCAKKWFMVIPKKGLWQNYLKHTSH